MLNLLFTSVLELSLSTGLVVAVFLALSPVLGKTVWPRWRCLLWTLLALRLLLPFSLPARTPRFTSPCPPSGLRTGCFHPLRTCQ